MNHSMYNADHRTHIKIFGLGLACALLVAIVGEFGHIGTTSVGAAPVVKAGRTIVMTGDPLVIR